MLWYGRHGGLLGAIRVASVEAGALLQAARTRGAARPARLLR
ncbi:hypothetical protein L665_01235 [Ralstonia solanacearum SD54]|nr:hypothetical protein F504_1741 [Ralstonia pseudosolanacearum FQY_4]ANH32939.1 hypothetical protein A3768_1786 [Ralstonia solanacearum]ESS50035.1 hypothetical protein L665_01235 [Ralstonia solanacearum SD54]